MKFALLFAVVVIGFIGYALFSSPAPRNPPRESSEVARAASVDKAKAEEDALAKAEAEKKEAEDKARVAQEAEAKAEAEKKEAAAKAEENAKLDAKKAKLAEKQKAYADMSSQVAQAASLYAALSQKPVEDAAAEADKSKAADLKSQLRQATDRYLQAKTAYDAAKDKADAASNQMGNVKGSSDYKSWRYVGEEGLRPMSELNGRDKKRRIEYVSGDKASKYDVQKDALIQAASSAKSSFDSAKSQKDAAQKAYDDFSVACKKAAEIKLASLKSKAASLSQEMADLK